MRSQMAKHEILWPKIIPGFDALKMKQELQERVYRETEGMTKEEIREHIRKGSEAFWADIERIRAKKKARQIKKAAPQLVGQ